MRSAGCAKRVNYRICFCHLSAMNFKTWRRVALKEGLRCLEPTKNFFARAKYRAENPTQNLKNR